MKLKKTCFLLASSLLIFSCAKKTDDGENSNFQTENSNQQNIGKEQNQSVQEEPAPTAHVEELPAEEVKQKEEPSREETPQPEEQEESPQQEETPPVTEPEKEAPKEEPPKEEPKPKEEKPAEESKPEPPKEQEPKEEAPAKEEKKAEEQKKEKAEPEKPKEEPKVQEEPPASDEKNEEDEYARSVGDVQVSKDDFKKDKTNVLAVIDDLAKVMADKDFKTWLQYVDSSSTQYWSQGVNLKKAQKRLPIKGLQLRTLEDYFKYVFIPSRSGREVTEIRYISDSYIKAVQVQDNTDIIYYYFNKIDGIWKLHLPPIDN